MLAENEKPTYTIADRTSVAVLNAAAAGALNSDANGETAFTAGANGSRVTTLSGNSSDTAAINLFVYIKKASGLIINLGMVNIPINAGNASGVPNVDLLDSTKLLGMHIDGTGKRYIPLEALDQLKVSTLANMTAAKICTVAAIGSDY